ncbi:type VI secretion system baseplate subunit TssG [Niveibacterium sp. SC-1]|uniref:type VI secretion system baseplate subunit TssG n=1 Tax=Niveibacterium sp. SC-1 TaxID=3135646 RepID=UPI00311D919D
MSEAAISWREDPFWRAVCKAPHEFDLFQVLRWLDARAGAPEPLGRAHRPQEEPVRLRQEASMAFAPATLAQVQAPEGSKPELSIYSFGLFGPNGPLPLHLTEYARERERFADDPAFAAFADLFHHRLILLFYRAWADAQATVSLDRVDERPRFDDYLACLLSRGLPAHQERDELGEHARFYQAAHLVRQARNPEGLQQILQRYFDVPVRIEENVLRWVELAPEHCFGLGLGGSPLGQDSTLGVAVRDAQSHFRIVLGPLTQAEYRRFLPDGDRVPALRRWVQDYVGMELSWDVRLLLASDEVPQANLSGAQPPGLALELGQWLGRRPEAAPAGDLVLDYTARRRTTTLRRRSAAAEMPKTSSGSIIATSPDPAPEGQPASGRTLEPAS